VAELRLAEERLRSIRTGLRCHIADVSSPRAKRIALLVFLAAILACRGDVTSPESANSEAGLVAAGVPLTAHVEFGTEEGSRGSPFPPAQHDRSFHSFDKLRPRTVVIAQGGSVTFEVYPLHQPAIYEPGTRPGDIDITETEPIPIFPDLERITDDDGLIVRAPDQSFDEVEWTTPPGTFAEPGRYLVICTTWVHFVEANMYGWVIVK
jgi:hypothetical protein